MINRIRRKTMVDSFYFFILMHLILAFTVTGREHFFRNQIKKRYQTFYNTKTARTFVHCVIICSLEDQCVAVNYNTATYACQLIDVKDANKQDTLTVAETWTATMKGIYLYLSIYLSIYLRVRLFVRPSVRLSVRPSVYLYVPYVSVLNTILWLINYKQYMK